MNQSKGWSCLDKSSSHTPLFKSQSDNALALCTLRSSQVICFISSLSPQGYNANLHHSSSSRQLTVSSICCNEGEKKKDHTLYLAGCLQQNNNKRRQQVLLPVQQISNLCSLQLKQARHFHTQPSKCAKSISWPDSCWQCCSSTNWRQPNYLYTKIKRHGPQDKGRNMT